MKRGFTILELLVASLLLGMLVSVLTMLFNQSSISWRTGVATVESLDEVRSNIASLRDEADNVYIWNDEIYHLTGLWDENGQLRERAWDIDGASSTAKYPRMEGEGGRLDDSTQLNDFKPVNVGSGGGISALKSYMVNVKSAGPNKVFGDYDDIWSYPDAIEID